MAWDHLKWIIFILIGIWIVWFFMGGPQKYGDKEGIFIKPPAPIDTGETYGPEKN